tara:strand:+ start:5332 stop:6156 length:825 start_codon:yes stop_codon:yes gene_type:complete
MLKHSSFYILIIGLWCIPNWGMAQRKAYKIQKNNKNNYEAFPNPFDFRPDGWLFEAALNGTTSLKGEVVATYGDTTLTTSGTLRPGLSFGAGRYHSMKKGHKIVKYIDYNLGYKLLWNSENQKRDLASTNTSESFTNTNYSHYANANFNLNNLISFSDYLFLQNTLGVNVDYRFASARSGNGTNAQIAPPNFVVQLHYKLALGFMFDNDKAIIPYLEVPVFNITPTQKNFSQLDYFNGSYQTFIVGVRVMLFRLGQKECPKAINTDGKAKNNGY